MDEQERAKLRLAILLAIAGRGRPTGEQRDAADRVLKQVLIPVLAKARNESQAASGAERTIAELEQDAEASTELGDPWCNHDPVAVTDGYCECGAVRVNGVWHYPTPF
jgi:hypothetical protein